MFSHNCCVDQLNLQRFFFKWKNPGPYFFIRIKAVGGDIETCLQRWQQNNRDQQPV